MLRADTIVCGTTTTGTGTLTLSATPVPPGGIDFDVWARSTGIGFGNSAAVFTSYTVIEYTDNTFASAKSFEKGVGTLTLGSSSGIANATLARTTVQDTGSSLNSQPATAVYSGPTAFSIGTAANTLVFIGPSASDLLAFNPYIESSGGPNAIAAAYPLGIPTNVTAGTALVSGTDYYVPFIWPMPMLVKRAYVSVALAYSGGTPVSNSYGRIYQINSAGRPGKLLYDFGLMGSTGVSLNSAVVISSGASGNGFLLLPGEYIFDFLPSFSGGTTPPKLTIPSGGGMYLNAGKFGSNFGLLSCNQAAATGGTTGTAPDPANLTGYATATGGAFNYTLGLAAS